MTAERRPPSKHIRFLISALLVGHLLAVLLPPLSFQTRGPLGPSPSIQTLMGLLEPYTQFLYIDRGYAFFAPDPGPSHLVQAAITDRGGQQVEMMFPDLEQQWPRLLYHRHFMLSEYLNEIYQPPGPPPELVELDRQAAEFWAGSRARYEHLRQSIVAHLEHEHPGKTVAIRRVEHLIPDLQEYQQQPIALTDPRLYQVMLDQPVEVAPPEDLLRPAAPPETIPPPEGAELDQTAPTEPVTSESSASANREKVSPWGPPIDLRQGLGHDGAQSAEATSTSGAEGGSS